MLGRPTNLTPELAEDIAQAIRRGAKPADAAGAYGVPFGTFHEWMGRGNGQDPLRPALPLYIEFAEAVHRAEQICKAAIALMAVEKIKTTADAMLFLSRRFPDEWRERVDVRLELQAEVRRLADESGVDYDEALAEAERILASVR
jgi:hypothetical protein